MNEKIYQEDFEKVLQNQEENNKTTTEIYNILADQVEKQAEAEAEQASEESSETVLFSSEDGSEYTLEMYISDSKQYQETQLELLTEIRDDIQVNQEISVVSACFSGILIGVILCSILARYLHN